MKIIIWSDFVCPFCYIGINNLKKAMTNLNISEEDINIHYRSFILDPNAEYVPELSYKDYFMTSKRINDNQSQELLDQVSDMAKESGLPMNIEGVVMGNTLPAHRLFKYADTEGKGVEFFDRLYQAVFVDNDNAFASENLIKYATELGLSESQVKAVLEDEELFFERVNQDIQDMHQIGAQGVPFMVINDKYAVPGAQPVEIFEQALGKVLEDEDAK